MSFAAAVAMVSAACAGDCFNVRDFGAKGDGVTKDTAAIQRAIDEVAAKGGGRVVLPKGVWRSGTIYLKSNVEFHLEEGATLLGSGDLKDYNAEDIHPENFGCHGEGWRGHHLVYAYRAENVAITGAGMIDGNGRAFFKRFEPQPRYTNFVWRRGYVNAVDYKNAIRPGQMLSFQLCRGVKVQGVTLRDSTCWTCHFHGCTDVLAENVTICNPLFHANTDGFDIDCCRKVLVRNCAIETGDDVFAIRGDARRLGAEAQVCGDIMISNCVAACAASGVRIGVGTGVIDGVTIKDIRFREAGHALLLQSIYASAKHGGVAIRNILFENVSCQDSGHGYIVSVGCPNAEQPLENVVFRNCRMRTNGALIVEGVGKVRPKNILFDNCELTLAPYVFPRWQEKDWEVYNLANTNNAAVCIEKADGVVFKNFKINREPGLAPGRERDFLIVDADVGRLRRREYKAEYDVNEVPAIGQNAADMRGSANSGHPRVLILGNSITRHGPSLKMGWTNDFGMAATAIEKDYAHVLAAKIKHDFPTAGFALANIAATFEWRFRDGLALEKDFGWMREWRPDYVVMFFGANCAKEYDQSPTGKFGARLEELRSFLDNGKTKFLLVEGFYRRPVLDAEKKQLAEKHGDIYVPMDDIRSRDDVRGRFNHPDDHGMRLIAERIWTHLRPVLIR